MSASFDRVFVVTYGRSGSTLLQSLLNAIPGYRIYGENASFLFKLQESYDALLEANSHLANPKNDNESQPWFGSSRFTEAQVTADFRQFINKMLFQPYMDREHRVFGFKEIRHIGVASERMERYLEFIRKMFPRAAVIFNTRNIEDVLRSGWWRRNFWAGLPRQLAEFHEFCDGYVARSDGHAIHVTYDALIRPGRAEVERLLAFLGETLPDETVERVFQASHSYENRSITAYLSGRGDFIELEAADWWRSNIEEFKVDVAMSESGCRLTGVILPAPQRLVNLFIEVANQRMELTGTLSTPKLQSLFTANPQAANAGFDLETPADEVLSLYGRTEDASEILVGRIWTRPGMSRKHIQVGPTPRAGEPGARAR